MKYALLLLTTLLSFSTKAQFQACNSSTNHSLNDVYFFDATTGIVVGDSGTIIRSVDGGLNWNIVLSEPSINFKRVRFFDAQYGMAIGTATYQTSDGGLSWTAAPTSGFTRDLAILNDSTAVLSTTQAILRSTDRGSSWDTTFYSTPGGSNFGLLSFVDENIGYCAGELTQQTFKTTDGGLNWTFLPGQVAQQGNTVLEAMSFVSEDRGFKAGWYIAHLQRTTDGGANWAYVTDAASNSTLWADLYDLHINPAHIYAFYACGWNGRILKSVDNGATWIELNSGLSSNTRLHSIYFIDSEIGWVVGYGGIILKTTSGGVGIDELNAQQEFSISVYPNPTSDILSIAEHRSIASVELFSSSGQLVLRTSSVENVAISALVQGLYLVKAKLHDGRIATAQFEKQ